MKRKIGFLTFLIAILLLGLSSATYAQKKKKQDDAKLSITASDAKKDADSTKKKEPSKLKKYTEVITKGMQSQKGFISVYQKDDKFYFEVPFRIFKKDILAVNRIAQASVDMRNGELGSCW